VAGTTGAATAVASGGRPDSAPAAAELVVDSEGLTVLRAFRGTLVDLLIDLTQVEDVDLDLLPVFRRLAGEWGDADRVALIVEGESAMLQAIRALRDVVPREVRIYLPIGRPVARSWIAAG
jgi:hypothetical protein